MHTQRGWQPIIKGTWGSQGQAIVQLSRHGQKCKSSNDEQHRGTKKATPTHSVQGQREGSRAQAISTRDRLGTSRSFLVHRVQEAPPKRGGS